jgi:hypothetical protein
MIEEDDGEYRSSSSSSRDELGSIKMRMLRRRGPLMIGEEDT